ncbi:MAG: TolC family protein [Planctomycetota bacterium]
MRRFCRILSVPLLLSLGCNSARQLSLSFSNDSTRSSNSTVKAPVDAAPGSLSAIAATETSEIPPVAPSGETEQRDPAKVIQSVVSSDLSGAENQASDAEAAVEVSEDGLVLTSAVDDKPAPIVFDEVIGSVYQSYPLLEAALFSRNIALGQQVGASGAFDTKLKAASENGPQGFYQTYRQNVGVVQPTYWGGEVFAGYRIGRGDYQPWYLERQTNGGGEFKAGIQVPLARNRTIDSRRAELWKAGYARTMAEPEIQAQLIGFVQEASYSYWEWVAAGEYHMIARRILALAEDRTSRIEAQVKAGFIDPPELTDNLRLVAIRQAKVADTRRKLEQTSAKLSIYLRDTSGDPLLALESQLPGFPEPTPVDDDLLDTNIASALAQRPELRVLDLMRQQTQVDYTEARNQLQPELNAVVWGSQDVGDPTSAKRDKSPYESEASLYLDVPMQRRKARGKMTELQGKLAQLSAKRRITADKISVDVRAAHAALKSAWEQVGETRRSLEYAEDLAARERKNQEAGLSDLLKVTLREQYAVESAEKNVDALKLYFDAQADYRAAMAQDRLGANE